MCTNLNNEQKKAIESNNSHVLVLAGPGSGKTHTLVTKIEYMVEEKGVSPKEILVITFSKKAALEMQDRFEKLVKPKIYPVYFGTFHAIYYSIIKEHYRFDKNSILSESNKRKYLREILNKNNVEIKDDALVDEFISKISLYKTLSDESKKEIFLSNFERREDSILFQNVYEMYVKKCRDNNKLDFDDMLFLCKEVLTKNENILNKYQNIYKYILVDEFQDINDVQYDVLMMLSKKCKQIFVVGDDDQSIYGFRGSRPELMRQFINEYRDCVVIDMNKNYRCAEYIVSKAHKLIRINANRIEKKQIACKHDKNTGEVVINSFTNASLEADYVIESINRLKSEEGFNCSVAILYRTAKCANYLEEMLKFSGIKYSRKCESANFYDADWVKDIFAYLRTINGECNLDTLFRIINKPDRQIDRDVLLDIVECESNRFVIVKDEKKLNKYTYDEINSIKFFIENINRISNMDCFSAVAFILKRMQYERYLYKHLRGLGFSDDYINDSVEDLLEICKKFSSIKDWITYVDTINGTEVKKQINTESNYVSMMSIHASKGLEFDAVFVLGLQEGIFPHRKAITDDLLEEERRLLYVAMTRAKKYLFVLGRGEEKNGKRISRFIAELNG